MGGLLLLLLLVPGGAGAGRCGLHWSCEGCLRAHPSCAWCQEPDFPGGAWPGTPRCAPREVLERAGCPPRAVLDPRGELEEEEEEEEEGGTGGQGGEPPQLRPRRVRLVLRLGEEQSFQVRFRRAPTHPVDLYYLMDLSYSMKDDLEHVRRLGGDLLTALRNVTPSIRIGFGSFVDKPVLPYVSTAPSKLRHPCPGRGEPCAPPVAFRHLLPLSADPAAFARSVRGQRVSGNLDAPEGGFDAIMQVALCQGRMGWRPGSRLLLFASDDVPHAAGDGKLGGIVLPPDTRCHLDARGLYSKSHLYDYPSVGHLAQVLVAADIQPIFAVTAPVLPVYQELSRQIPKSVVGELRDDSSNVVQLIADAYERISSTVELQHSPLPPGISITYESHCGDPPPGPPRPPRTHGGLCTGVGVGQEVRFRVRVRAGGCLPAPPQRVSLRVPGGGPEVLSLELGTLCTCPCAPPQPHAPHCHGGDLRCGVCSCPPGRRGTRCECEEGPGGGCSPPKGTDPPCGGRGCPGGGRRCGRCEGCPPCPPPCQRHRGCAACSALGGVSLGGGGNCSSLCGRVTPRVVPEPPRAAPPPPRGWCRAETPDGRRLLFLIEGGEEEEEEGGGGHVTLSVWLEEAGGGGGPLPWLVAAGPVVAVVALGLVVLGGVRLALELRHRRQQSKSGGNLGYRPH